MTELERLKLMAEEHGGTEACPLPRMYTDQELEQLLELHGGDARAAAYEVLIRKAENTGITLPGGLARPDQSARYLRMAASVRGCRTRNAARADAFPPEPPAKGGDAP